MDPTPSELQAISTLKEVRDWVGIHDAVWQGICESMGAFKFIREVVLVSPGAWDKGVRDAEVGEDWLVCASCLTVAAPPPRCHWRG